MNSDLLDALPLYDEYPVYKEHGDRNWWSFHQIIRFTTVRESLQATDNARLSSLQNNRFFRKEVNEALLKILLSPPEIFFTLVGYYFQGEELADDLRCLISMNKDKIISFFISQQSMFRQAALENVSFGQYIETEAALTVASEFAAELGQFRLSKKQQLVSNSYTVGYIIEEFLVLRDESVQRLQLQEERQKMSSRPAC